MAVIVDIRDAQFVTDFNFLPSRASNSTWLGRPSGIPSRNDYADSFDALNGANTKRDTDYAKYLLHSNDLRLAEAH